MISRWIRQILFMDYRILHPKGYHVAKCPNCGQFASLERLPHYKVWEKFVKNLGFKKYHCTKCKWDGYLHTITFTDNPKKVFKNYIIALFLFIIFGILLFFVLSDYYDTL